MADAQTVLEDGAQPPIRERRRPGRLKHVDAALLPLLRGEPAPELELPLGSSDNLAGATGIAVSVLLSGAIWAIGYMLL
jgi:hypothetical protein